MKQSLYDKVISFTTEHALFESVQSAVIGVSGGADSMCLLDMLHRNGRLALTVVHVHHGIRGDEADRDVAFVRSECEARGLPLMLVRADVPRIAADEKCGLEEAGRLARYAILRHIAQSVGADCIMTAHTASDQVETVLHNIVRGCGVSGLCGMAPASDGIVRPLLCCTRAEIEAYCDRHGVSYVTDSTNADESYTRNALRHSVLPLLHRINPSVDEALLRLSIAANEDDRLLSDMAAEQLLSAQIDTGVYARTPLLSLAAPIRYRVLRQALAAIDCRSMEQRHFTTFDAMLQKGSGCVQLPGGYCLCVDGDHLRVGAVELMPSNTPIPSPLSVDCMPFSAVFGDYAVNMTVENRESIINFKKVHKMFFKYAIDYDKINTGLYWRIRQAGDYLHPAGRHVGKALKTLMSEWQMPGNVRMRYPLLCDNDGIVMVPGYCCDERVRTDEDTNHFLVCTVEKVSP